MFIFQYYFALLFGYYFYESRKETPRHSQAVAFENLHKITMNANEKK